MRKTKQDTYASVWDAIADTPEEAANLRVRSELMEQIAAIVKEGGWTQAEAAARCGVTQPRINDLLRGRIARFSLDALVNMASALGRRVHVALEAAQLHLIEPARGSAMSRRSSKPSPHSAARCW